MKGIYLVFIYGSLFFLQANQDHILRIPEEFVRLRKTTPDQIEHPVQNDEYMISASGLMQVNNGENIFYYREIYTSVCSSDLCYPANVVFYWDPIGNFIGYELPPGERLTKIDHQPFSPEEYDKLLSTLQNPYSSLRYYDISELVNEEDAIDGVSGATNKEVVNLVVPGAVYTFYTLWKLAQGDINKSIRSISTASIEKNILEKWLSGKDDQKVIFAIKAIQERKIQDDDFYLKLYEIYRNSTEETANFALRSFPEDELQSLTYQKRLAHDLPALSFSRRSTLYIKLLEFNHYYPGLIESLAKLLNSVDEWQKVAILNVLLKAAPVSAEVCLEVEKIASSGNPEINKKANEILSTRCGG